MSDAAWLAQRTQPAARGDQGDPFRLAGGVLTITGGIADDAIRVWETADGLLRALLANETERVNFSARQSEVRRLNIGGFGGDDQLVNLTDKPATLEGHVGDDRLVGGLGQDRLLGGDGRDAIFGRDGDDFLDGGSGQDRLFGGRGDDRLFGSEHRDILRGQDGDDHLDGGSGPDIARGDAGQDRIWGQLGNDRLVGNDGNDQLLGGHGNDRLLGGDGHDRLFGQAGHDRLVGQSGNDLLTGQAGHDHLVAGADHDRLIGGTGRDRLWGGSGHDGLIMGAGPDQAWGGGGDDRFLQLGANTIHDRSSWDAGMRFFNSGTYTVNIGGQLSTYEAGRFTLSELVWIDQSFDLVQRHSFRAELLKTSNRSDLRFYRHGDVRGVGPGWLGWNLGGQQIHLTARAFQSRDWLTQTVVHELAHNWDDTRENSSISQFRALSGWSVLNGRWRFRPGSTNFARRYGMSRPEEDFATAFAAYFFQFSNLRYGGLPAGNQGIGAQAAPRKMDYVARFVRTPRG